MEHKTNSTSRALRRYALLFAIAIPAGYGCVATTSGSGDTTPVSFTTEGTASTLKRPLENVDAKTKAVLADNGIAITDTSTEKGGDYREYKGKAHDLDITVSLTREGPQATKVEVTARKNLVEWNKDFAKKLNDQIAAPT